MKNTFRQGDSLLTKQGDPQLVPVRRHTFGIPFGKRLVCLSDILLHLGPIHFFIVLFLTLISLVSKEYNVVVLDLCNVIETMCKLSFG